MTADVLPFSGVEKTLRELVEIGEVEFNRLQSNGHHFVSVKPYRHGPLWWYGCHETMEGALRECREKAVQLRFIADATPAKDQTP